MYRERFLMVRQRVHRHDLFRPPIIESSRREYIKLSPLDSLVSYAGLAVLCWIVAAAAAAPAPAPAAAAVAVLSMPPLLPLLVSTCRRCRRWEAPTYAGFWACSRSRRRGSTFSRTSSRGYRSISPTRYDPSLTLSTAVAVAVVFLSTLCCWRPLAAELVTCLSRRWGTAKWSLCRALRSADLAAPVSLVSILLKRVVEALSSLRMGILRFLPHSALSDKGGGL